MEKVRIAIIGLGGMGACHAEYIRKGEVPGGELAAVCDTDPKRLQYAKDTFGEKVQRFESAEALFAAKICDGVLIATPHYFHPPLAIAAFRQGLHVLSEKPAGVFTRQVREMNEAAAKSGRVFGMMFNQRTLAVNQKAKQALASGELGALKRSQYIKTTWFRSQSYYDSGTWRATWSGEGGGTLLNQCPHDLDLWQWFTGLPRRVRAFCSFGKYHNIEVEDDVTAYVEYENGATGVFIASTGEAPGCNSLEFACDQGKLVLEGEKLIFYRTTVPVSRFVRESPKPFAAPEVWKCEIPGGGGEAHRGITANWVQAILKGTPLLAPGEEGMASLQLINAMLLSAWTDAWVDLPVDEEKYLQHLQEKIRTSKFKKAEARNAAFSVAGSF